MREGTKSAGCRYNESRSLSGTITRANVIQVTLKMHDRQWVAQCHFWILPCGNLTKAVNSVRHPARQVPTGRGTRPEVASTRIRASPKMRCHPDLEIFRTRRLSKCGNWRWRPAIAPHPCPRYPGWPAIRRRRRRRGPRCAAGSGGSPSGSRAPGRADDRGSPPPRPGAGGQARSWPPARRRPRASA